MNARVGDLAGRGPLGLKEPKAKPDPAYLAKVRALPCCICEAFGEMQHTPTTAHHVIHGRFSQRKVPDRMTIPLCADHHQLGGNGKTALHSEPTKWKRLYGDDFDFIPATQDRILK